jgi:hypothetical protein
MEPSTFKVSSLVEKCANKEFLLPEIQRGFVWKKTQIRDLIDSLYHDYPTGSILGWEADEQPIARPIGDAKPRKDTRVELLILDGQQRLTALYAAFGNPINGKQVEIWFNIDTEAFAIHRRSNLNLPWVSVTQVVNEGAVTTAQRLDLLSNPKIGEYLERLNRLERIKEYTYQVYVLRKVSYQQVTDIFQRVNSKGTRLQQSELAIAQLAFSLPGLITDEINAFLHELEGLGFKFHLPFFMRCLHAVLSNSLGNPLRADFKIFQSEIKELRKTNLDYEAVLKEGWKQTRKSIQRLVNILKNTLGIQSSEWIASENALVIPVFYLSLDTVPEPDVKSMLIWLLHALMWGRYSGAAETVLDRDFQLLLSASLPSFKELLRQTRREVKEEDLRRAGSQSPFRIMLYLASRYKKAKDWSRDQVIISSTGIGDNSLQFHHIFPTAYLKSKEKYVESLANQIANLTFISRVSNRSISMTEPSHYLAELRRKDQQLLDFHFIPIDPPLWNVDKFSSFLKARRTLIARGINEFLNGFEV